MSDEATTEANKAAGLKTSPPRKDCKCTIEKCKRPYRAKGYCNVHYKMWRHGDLPYTRYKICTKEACRKKRFVASLCEEHAKSEAAAA